MANAPQAEETIDPRVLRSRQMLMDALTELLAKKEFEDISVQEIADQSSLNRATFYLHYPDKATLLKALSAARFGQLIARRALFLLRLRRSIARHRSWSVRLPDRKPRLSRQPVETAVRRFHHSGARRYIPQGRGEARGAPGD